MTSVRMSPDVENNLPGHLSDESLRMREDAPLLEGFLKSSLIQVL